MFVSICDVCHMSFNPEEEGYASLEYRLCGDHDYDPLTDNARRDLETIEERKAI